MQMPLIFHFKYTKQTCFRHIILLLMHVSHRVYSISKALNKNDFLVPVRFPCWAVVILVSTKVKTIESKEVASNTLLPWFDFISPDNGQNFFFFIVVNAEEKGNLNQMYEMFTWYTKARFRRRTFHEPNLIHWIKYMKSSASESISNACFNLERFSRSFRLARPGISPLERLWNAFDSDAELFMYRTKCRNSYNVFCKQFDRNAHFSPSEFSSAGIKIGVWITLAGLNNLGRS